MMMDNNIRWKPFFGDGSEQQSGLFGKLCRKKRVLTGESLFMTAFINQHHSKAKYLCFSLSWKNLPIDLTEFQGKFICQKLIFMRS
jgi:uncharacterized protein (AIM24 family)